MRVSILSVALLFAAGASADIFGPPTCSDSRDRGLPCCNPRCITPPTVWPGIPKDLCDWPGMSDCSTLPPGTGTSGGRPGWGSAGGVYSGSTGGVRKWDPAHGPYHDDDDDDDHDDDYGDDDGKADSVAPPTQRKSLGVTNLPRRWIRGIMGRV